MFTFAIYYCDMLYPIIKPLLFTLKPEDAHYTAMNALSKMAGVKPGALLLSMIYSGKSFDKSVEVAGITFPNQVGLAAGFDKDARWIDALSTLGFGHVEVGTLTPKPQSGNPEPRLFRLLKDEALINRMGFNNQGVEVAAARIQRAKADCIIGGNIGKNKVTPNEEAIADYAYCFEALYDQVDYFTVNVSSPNTPGLRALQEKEPLSALLKHLSMMRKEKVEKGKARRPLFLKIAPDLTPYQLTEIVEIVQESDFDGIVATNTTVERGGLNTQATELEQIGMGGLSGKPVRKRSTEVIEFLYKESQGRIPIIGVGGIFTAADAQEKLDAGASLVQVYTGFIYEGPGMVKAIKKGLYQK